MRLRRLQWRQRRVRQLLRRQRRLRLRRSIFIFCIFTISPFFCKFLHAYFQDFFLQNIFHISVRQTARHHTTTTCILSPRAQRHTQTTSMHTRAGTLTFPSSCLDGCVTRVGPGQNPQFTRASLAREAVGCSQNNHHNTPPRRPMSPTTLETMKSRMVAKPWSNHGNRVTVNVTGDRRVRRVTRRGDRQSRAADPDADGEGQWRCPASDRGTPSSCAPSDGAGWRARGGLSHRVHEDDREEETLQSDAETAEKVTINEASALLSVETTLT